MEGDERPAPVALRKLCPAVEEEPVRAPVGGKGHDRLYLLGAAAGFAAVAAVLGRQH